MPSKKYSKYVRTLEFKESRPDFYRQGLKLGPDFFGFDIQLEIGTYVAPGTIGRNPGKPHFHSFDQVMVWLGVDTNDMGDLDAEIEICLGENLDRVNSQLDPLTKVFNRRALNTFLQDICSKGNSALSCYNT